MIKKLIQVIKFSFTRINNLILPSSSSKVQRDPKIVLRELPWYEANGDKTLRIDYDLNKDSIVFDLGGYVGDWSKQIHNKYRCNIYIYEPVKKYANIIRNRFSGNSKLNIFEFGLSDNDINIQIGIDDNASSIYSNSANKDLISLKNISKFLEKEKVDFIDLMKINIEGGEYDLLEHIINNGLIYKINNIQIQFHDFVPNADFRMRKIQSELSKTHKLTYQYEFVWENWLLK